MVKIAPQYTMFPVASVDTSVISDLDSVTGTCCYMIGDECESIANMPSDQHGVFISYWWTQWNVVHIFFGGQTNGAWYRSGDGNGGWHSWVSLT